MGSNLEAHNLVGSSTLETFQKISWPVTFFFGGVCVCVCPDDNPNWFWWSKKEQFFWLPTEGNLNSPSNPENKSLDSQNAKMKWHMVLQLWGWQYKLERANFWLCRTTCLFYVSIIFSFYLCAGDGCEGGIWRHGLRLAFAGIVYWLYRTFCSNFDHFDGKLEEEEKLRSESKTCQLPCPAAYSLWVFLLFILFNKLQALTFVSCVDNAVLNWLRLCFRKSSWGVLQVLQQIIVESAFFLQEKKCRKQEKTLNITFSLFAYLSACGDAAPIPKLKAVA